MPKRHVLLVDDNESDLLIAQAALELSGLEATVCVARDGVEALEYLRCAGRYEGRTTGDPNVVLLDLNMPRMNGLEVLEELRRDLLLRHIPVVILTTSNAEQDVYGSYERGTNAYVVKPVTFDGTVTAMQTLAAFWVTLNNTVEAQERGANSKSF